MYYIYCYTNKINGHKYVGQTNNYKRRINEHKSCAYNEKALSYNDLIHKKIREYGIENFEISILETLYTDDQKIVNDRESFWIKELSTFRGTGLGYNSDLGGSRKHCSTLTEEQLKTLKEEIKAGIAYYELENKYNISASFISGINHGVYFADDKTEYPLFKYYKSNEDYDELINLLLYSDLSYRAIAQQLGIGESTVKKINYGTLRKGLYPSYPIRKKTPLQIKGEKVQSLLLTTNLTKKQIAQQCKCDEETVSRINSGKTHHNDTLTYPLRRSL